MSGLQKHRTPGGNRGFGKAAAFGGHADLTALRSLYGNGAAADFADVARASGLVISGPATGDGEVHRVHVQGDRANTRNGWYVLHLDGIPAGAFSSWKTSGVETWRASGARQPDAQEGRRLMAAMAAAKAQREAETRARWEKAQGKANHAWSAAVAADPVHPYLAAKGVQAHGIRQLGDLLLVPLRDADGVLWNLQSIAPDGTKRFGAGGRKGGLFHAIGTAVDRDLCVCEGYATAVSVHVATGHPTAVAFDCGNLLPVSRALRGKYPAAKITICADNDTETPGNPGLTKATEAAAAVSGSVAVPPDGFNDFNDAANAAVPA